MIKVFKTTKYRNIKVIYRQIGEIFEYLVPFRNNIYSTHIRIRPKWHRRVLKNPYTEKDLQAILITLEKASQETIKTILKRKKHIDNK